MRWFKSSRTQVPVYEPFSQFAVRYGGTEDSCADAYLDGRMETADRQDYEERFFVANRILLRLLPRLRRKKVL